MAGPYLNLDEHCRKLDRRNTRYRFDLDNDIPWADIAAPGLFLPPGVLADMGVHVDGLQTKPEAFALFQWAAALSLSLEFIELERGILSFVAAEGKDLGPTRSATLLCEEEEKHIAMFVRIANELREQKPDVAPAIERLLHARRGEWFLDRSRYPDTASYHYDFWLTTLFFEDFTIYLHERLAARAAKIQPTWLAAHAMHRREEEQHVVTDVAHIEACILDEESRMLWSTRTYVWLTANFGRFIGLDIPDALVRARFPGLAMRPLRAFATTGIHRDLLEHKLFRRSRAAWPHLAQNLAPSHVSPVSETRQVLPSKLPDTSSPTRRPGWIHAARNTVLGFARRVRDFDEPAIERFDLRSQPLSANSTRPITTEHASSELRGAAPRTVTLAHVPLPSVASTADNSQQPSEHRQHLEEIRAAWAAALGIPDANVGDNDTFESLGGDSLKAVDVLTGLEARLGHPIDAGILLRCRTVGDFAAFLSQRTAGEESSATTEATRSRVQEHEPIAIVAMAAHLPGASSLKELWTLIRSGRDVFRQVPEERWRASDYRDTEARGPGTTVCSAGSFLDDIGCTDAEALGLTEAQAAAADPQQRLFLELAGDVLEASGGQRNIGVFASAGWNEYFADLRQNPKLLGGHAALGNLENMVAARASQRFGLTGPALTLNAACASSHLAVHLACRSLRAGECNMAIAGAAQLNLGPVPFIAFSQAGVLSRSERCRPFSANADGFVPGEGAGAVLLQPLHRAVAEGHPILAVIRGSASNNDGGALSGMAPSPRGQLDALRAAYLDAGVEPKTVDLIEAHGTGTPIGDAVEVQALAQLVGSARDSGGSCQLTSIKSNLGHLMTAAGIASLIKVVLALRHREFPPLAGFDSPDPRVDFDCLGINPVAAAAPWPRSAGRARRAGITGLGIGGTNVHIVVDEAPPIPQQSPRTPPPRDCDVLCVSAPSKAHLLRVARVYADRLEEADPDARCREIAAINRRAHRFPQRRSVVGDAAELVRALRQRTPFSKNESGVGNQLGSVGNQLYSVGDQPRIGFVFSGPGSQYPGMAEPLYRGAPAFRDAIDNCTRVLSGHLPRSLPDYLFEDLSGDPETAAMHRIDITQPIVFSVGYALSAWLADMGVQPTAVLGHSAGEYIAACVAGAMSLEQALTLVTRRGAAMARAPSGQMAAVFASEAHVRRILGDHLQFNDVHAAVGIAAVNAPEQVVLSGASDTLATSLAALENAGVGSHILSISCAAHSPLMTSAQAELRPFAEYAEYAALTIPLYSTVSGKRMAAGETMLADYWVQHLRAPVQFSSAVQAMAKDVDVLLEVGASGGLIPCLEAACPDREAIPLLRRANASSWRPPLEALGRLAERGTRVRLEKLSRPEDLELPDSPYPYERRHLWHGLTIPTMPPNVPSQIPTDPEEQIAPRSWTLAAESEVHIRDHRVNGSATAPGARLMELALEFVASIGDIQTTQPLTLSNLINVQPLSVESGPREVTAEFRDGRLTITSRPLVPRVGPSVPTTHFTARFAPRDSAASLPGGPAKLDIDSIRARCTTSLSRENLYEFLAATGMRYGDTVATVSTIDAASDELLATLDTADADGANEHRFHPGLVDGAMQAIGAFAAIARRRESATNLPTFLGFTVGRLTLYRKFTSSLVAHVRLLSPATADAMTVRAAVTLATATGEVCATFDEVGLKRVAEAPSPVVAMHRRPDTVILLGDTAEERHPMRRHFEDHGVFVLERAMPQIPQKNQDLTAALDGAGFYDGVLLFDPNESDVNHVCALLMKPGRPTIVDFVIATDNPSAKSLVDVAHAAGWRGPCRAIDIDDPTAVIDRPAAAGVPSSSPRASQSSPGSSSGIERFLAEQIAEALFLPTDAIDPRATFTRLGLDSLMAVEMVLRLERHYDTKLYPTLLFECPTIEAAAAVLRTRFGVVDDIVHAREESEL